MLTVLTVFRDNTDQTMYLGNFYNGSEPYVLKVLLFNIFLKCIGAFFGSKPKIWHLNTVSMIYE